MGELLIVWLNSSDWRILESSDDALADIRQRPSMFFRDGVDLELLAIGVVADALALDAKHVDITRANDWWLVHADIDWLRPEWRGDLLPLDFFHRVINYPTPGHGPIRSDILVHAFCQCVVSATSSERFVVCGAIPESDIVWSRLCPVGFRRTIGFALARPETAQK